MPKDTRRSGALRDRFAFQKRATGSDGWGNNTIPVGAFTSMFSLDCNLTPRNGGESVIADRLQGTQPFIVTIRWSVEAVKISNSWRMVEDPNRGNRVLNILSPPTDPDGKRQWLEFLAIFGVPT